MKTNLFIQTIITLGISLAEYTDVIIGITSIILTLIGCTFITHDKNKTLLWISLSCAALCILLCMFAWCCNRHWCIVPNLYGKSYGDAIISLQDHNLDGIVLLPLSNESISKENARIVWQSKEKDTVSAKEKTVFVVLDNNFGYEHNSLSKPLGFFDDREWTWVKRNNTIFIKQPIAYGNMKSTSPNAIAFDVYADSMSATLETILMDYLDTNKHNLQIKPGAFDDYLFIGKLCAYDNHDYRMRSIETTTVKGTMLVPAVIHNYNYGFYFSFYDEDGKHYDQSIPIVFLSEYQWNEQIS